MTVGTDTARTGPYTGNGSTTVFAYTFKLIDEAHLVATLTTTSTGVGVVQTLTTHYTVAGVGDEGGGNVTMVTAPAVGETLTFTRDVTKSQPTDLVNRAAVQPSTLETALDRGVQMVQDLDEEMARAVKQPVTSNTELTFPAPTGNGDKVVGFNSGGTDLEAKTVNTDAYITLPASATDNAVATFNGTSGTSLQESGVTIDDNDLMTAPGGFAGNKGADIASATTVVIGTDGDRFDITGTTTITGFTVAIGRQFTLQFDGAVLLTNGASLVLPGAANITTSAGDRFTFLATAADTVECISMALADAADMRTVAGSLAATDTGIGKHTIFVPASAMRATTSNGAAALNDVETTAGRPDMTAFDFDASADEHVQFQVAMPKSYGLGTFTARFFWQSTAADTDGVSWAIQAIAVTDNESIDQAYGTAIVVDDANQGAAEELLVSAESAAITAAGTPADADMYFFRVFRDVSDANDTATEDARLLGVWLHYTTDAGEDT